MAQFSGYYNATAEYKRRELCVCGAALHVGHMPDVQIQGSGYQA